MLYGKHSQRKFQVGCKCKEKHGASLRRYGAFYERRLYHLRQKVGRERRIPFEVSADPFYSESNMAHLRRGISALNAGKGVSHDIIEEDD